MASPIYPVQADLCWQKTLHFKQGFPWVHSKWVFLHFKKLLFMRPGMNSSARVIFLSFRRGKIHLGVQPSRTCPGNWWSEKLTSFCCSQQVIHHVTLQGFALLTLLSTWYPGMLLCILPQPQRKSHAINWGAGISEFQNKNRSLYLDILQRTYVMIKYTKVVEMRSASFI